MSSPIRSLKKFVLKVKTYVKEKKRAQIEALMNHKKTARWSKKTAIPHLLYALGVHGELTQERWTEIRLNVQGKKKNKNDHHKFKQTVAWLQAEVGAGANNLGNNFVHDLQKKYGSFVCVSPSGQVRVSPRWRDALKEDFRF